MDQYLVIEWIARILVSIAAVMIFDEFIIPIFLPRKETPIGVIWWARVITVVVVVFIVMKVVYPYN